MKKIFGFTDLRTYKQFKDPNNGDIDTMVEGIMSDSEKYRFVIIGSVSNGVGLRNILGSAQKLEINPKTGLNDEKNYFLETIFEKSKDKEVDFETTVGYTFLDGTYNNKSNSFFVNVYLSTDEGVFIFSKRRGVPYLDRCLPSKKEIQDYSSIFDELVEDRRFLNYRDIESVRQKSKKIIYGFRDGF